MSDPESAGAIAFRDVAEKLVKALEANRESDETVTISMED